MKPSRPVHRVLFVCLGNICRSPTAEVVFRAEAAKAGLTSVEIDSAGTGDWHVGSPPDARAIRHAAKRGYDLRSLRARQFEASDFARFDHIYAMDAAVLEQLEAMRPANYMGRLGLFLDLAPDMGLREVPDPYHMGPEGFEHVLDLVETASAALVSSLSSRRRA
jgi:low molecular weight protein-tyrosine phosphatase